MNTKKYSIILVDDELEVRKRIKSKIRHDLGFEVIDEAENGFDALELVERLNPDVVLADIKMPFINGLELAKRIRLEYPKTVVAFISGYDEFQYAKEAIELGVVGYLTKPITQKEVTDFLVKLKKRLDEEYQLYFNQERLDEMFKTNLPALVENQFNLLLVSPSISLEDLKKFQLYHIDLLNGEYVIGIIELEEEEDFLNTQRLRIFLINLLKKKFSGTYKSYYFNNQYGLTFIIKAETIDEADVETRLFDIYLIKKDFSDIKIKIGLSEAFNDFTRFTSMVLQAKEALSYSNYFNIGRIISYKDIKNREEINFKLSKDDFDNLSYVIRFQDKEEIHKQYVQLLQRMNYSKEHILNMQDFIIGLAAIYTNFASSINVDLFELLDQSIINILSGFDDVKKMLEYLEDLAIKIRDENIKNSEKQTNNIIDELVAYLETNYDDSALSMYSVANALGISISYISVLFHRKLNTTFNRYLIKIRMEKAMEFLKYTDYKIFEIANKVGYNDVYYFSHSFKKYTSKSPRTYRNEIQA